jgi:GH15 family glucan-1,4-alpha-glucosidase
MSKSLVFANGRLHVGLDEHGLVHDLYYPYVGLENHLEPHGIPHKIGVYIDGWLSWLDDPGWDITSRYHVSAMVGDTTATNDSLGIRLEITDAVDSETDMFLRTVHIINLRETRRQVTLYCHQAFQIADTVSSDSAQYRPDLPAVMHYKGDRVFLASLLVGNTWFDDFSIGTYDTASNSGTFRDAEDGRLEKNTVENGKVDSTLGLSCTLDAFDSVRASYVLIAAESVRDAEQLFSEFTTNGVIHYLARTAAYWYEWIHRAAVPARLGDTYTKIVDESLLVVAAHNDERGAVMASLDSSLRNHPQDDTYSFCWARDAVYALWPLLRLGYTDELLRFFDFCVSGLHEDGYLYHKYRADGSLGSTWLPYQYSDGTAYPPLQTDETASVLFLLGQYLSLIHISEPTRPY